MIERRDDHHQGHVVEVLGLDDALQVQQLAPGDQQRQHHGQAGVDGAGDEVRGEDRRVPAGQDGHRRSPRRPPSGPRSPAAWPARRRTGRPGRSAATGRPGRASRAPASGRAAAADGLLARVLQVVARRRQVRHHAHVEEDHADGQVRGDRHHVPDQRAQEVRPDLPLGRIGDDVVEDPEPAQVDQREQAGDRDGEDRHRLGRAGDRRAPLRAHQVQDGRDQRAGVGDSDPEDEVADVDAPADRNEMPATPMPVRI